MKSKAHKLIFNLSIKDLKDLGILKNKKKKKRKNNKRLKKFYKGIGFADKQNETRTAPNTQGYAFTNVGSIAADTQRLQNELAEKALKAPPPTPVEPTQPTDVILSNPQYIERPNNKNNDYEVALSYLYNTQKEINNQLNALTSNNPTSIDRNNPIIDTSGTDDDDDDGYNLYDTYDVASGGGSDTFKSQNNPSVYETPITKAMNELDKDHTSAQEYMDSGNIYKMEPTPIKPLPIEEDIKPAATMEQETTVSPMKTRRQRKNAEAITFLKSIEQKQKAGEITEALANYKIRYVEKCSEMGLKPNSDIVNASKSSIVNEEYNKLLRKQAYEKKKTNS